MPLRLRVAPWVWAPLLIFLVSRVADTLLILLAARDLGPEGWTGSFRVDPEAPATGSYREMVEGWDGQWYQSIARDGYPEGLNRADGEVQQSSWAFYPLFPFTVRAVMAVSGLPFAWSASLVTLGCAASAMVVLYGFLKDRTSPFVAGMTVTSLSFFPSAPVLQLAYSEGMALLWLAVALAALSSRRYGLVLAAAAALALTRPILLPLASAVAVHGLLRHRQEGPAFGRSDRLRVGALGVAVVGLFGLWPGVVAVATGAPSGYLDTQAAWVQLARDEPSWLLLGVRHSPVAALCLVALLSLFLGLVLVWRGARAWPVEVRAWGASYALYLVVATRPISSIFRLSLMTLVPWWPFPEVATPPRWVRVAVFCAWVAIGLVTQYLWLRWFFVPGPEALSFP